MSPHRGSVRWLPQRTSDRAAAAFGILIIAGIVVRQVGLHLGPGARDLIVLGQLLSAIGVVGVIVSLVVFAAKKRGLLLVEPGRFELMPRKGESCCCTWG